MWSTPVLRSTLLLVAVVGTFGMNFSVILPLLARFTFEGGAPLYGWLTSRCHSGRCSAPSCPPAGHGPPAAC